MLTAIHIWESMQLYLCILMQLICTNLPFLYKNSVRKYIQDAHSLDLTLPTVWKQNGNLICTKPSHSLKIILKRISLYSNLIVVIIMSPYNDEALMIHIMIDLFQNTRLRNDT